ncbi:MAG: GNAT family N-acetyltransferase [Candidatus Aenigmarchaeota archaeon]|nr:GNAT family N-acetyltransferase [Candidatus Aenigmarchaeota archaeon]
MRASNNININKIVIRQARVNDYEIVKELLVKSKQTTGKVFTRKRFANTLQDFGKYNLVAQKGKTVIGYVFGYDDSGKSGKPKFYGYMGRLVIDPKYRGMGIGKTLVDICLGKFKKSGYKIIFAGVKKDNLASKNLFEKHGFRDDDIILLRFFD